jgi:hypothetical protein
VTSPQVSWLVFKARAKRPSRTIFKLGARNQSSRNVKMEWNVTDAAAAGRKAMLISGQEPASLTNRGRKKTVCFV